MAEYDQAFIERISEMGYEEVLAYLQTLPEVERKAMEDAIYRAASHRAVKEHYEWLTGGLLD
jgi:hypothetical protein